MAGLNIEYVQAIENVKQIQETSSNLPDNSNYTKDLAYKALSVVYSYFLLDVAA